MHAARRVRYAVGVVAWALLAACGGGTNEGGVCEPGVRSCSGDQVQECRDDGQGYTGLHRCTGGYYCRDGECVPRGWGAPDGSGSDGGPTDVPAPPDLPGSDAPLPRDVSSPADRAESPDVRLDLALPPDLGTDAAVDVPPDPPDVVLATCGNGRLDPGEACDRAVPAGSPDACPADCPPPEGCSRWELQGAVTTCSAWCRERTVTVPLRGDGCCPDGASHETDGDCPLLCGNGRVDSGEACDTGLLPPAAGACPTGCAPPSGCTGWALEGTGCAAHCVVVPVVALVAGDGCCPPSATHTTDPDCPDACGNGIVDPGERCDTGILSGAAGSCPASCPVSDACTTWILEGEADECTAACRRDDVTVPLPGDGCCPSGADHTTDPDCAAPCGNGILEAGERCDPAIAVTRPGHCPDACAPAEGCAMETLVGIAEACSAECVASAITEVGPADGCCPAGATEREDADCVATCGNERLEPGEDCDGSVPGDVTCAGLGFPASGGRPRCTFRCTLDTLPCGPHELTYDRIVPLDPRPGTRGAYLDVAWWASGTGATIATDGGALLTYDAATEELTVAVASVQTAAALAYPFRTKRLVTLPGRDEILVVGYEVVSSSVGNGRGFVLDATTGTLTPVEALAHTGVMSMAATLSEDGREVLVVGATKSSSGVNWLYIYDIATWTLQRSGAFAGGPAITDVMWGRPNPGEPRFAITLEGWNGAHSHTWYMDWDTDQVQENGWGAGFGNPGRGGWRPGGRFGLAGSIGSSQILYVFTYYNSALTDWDGSYVAWYTTGVFWHPDGHRALVTGTPGGYDVQAYVFDLRPSGDDYDEADLVDVSLLGYEEDPYFGDFNKDFLAAAWRPGRCDEGLIVGDDGAGMTPAVGMLVRFRDVDDPDCR